MSGALYRKLFDDAALFPPGNAPMGEALPAHRAHLAGPRAGYVGPFLVADARVAELRAVLGREPQDDGRAPLAVAVTVPGGAGGVGAAVDAVLADPALRLAGVEVAAAPGGVREAAGALDSHLPEGAEGFGEVPRGAGVREDVEALVGSGHSAKFRTGGLTPEAHPGEDELAELLHAAVALGLPFKCTAGLHHAVRHTTREGFEQHGFLNVLLATGALLDGGGSGDAARILAERDGATVAGLAAGLTDGGAEEVRQRFRSFGTCSVTEPLEDLVVLGALPAPRPRRTLHH
ncbi:hypothetical protein [Nocardiopsis tropica]|uniref:Uncharacterized protein n=1 Tax=Nocardiopsis tropica TaxID=109330 RepID=A0ABU7KSW2_9ACTN|nr:hypothetical protein [Nocardiopsis umidischolae]MEE2052388.1 hypothetical protein [Nocardiopsis umidischolae]